MITIHILTAIITLGISGLQLFKPTNNGILLARLGIITTLSTGTLLALLNQTSLGRLCISGIVFVGICSIFTFFGERKLQT